MKNLAKNESGFAVIALALAVIAILTILVYSMQANLNMFFSSFNHNKAYYDAEIAIEKIAVELRQAYDLGQPISWADPNVLPKKYPLSGNLASFAQPNFQFPGPPGSSKICVDRSDGHINPTFTAAILPGTFAGLQICLDATDTAALTIRKISLNSSDQWRAIRWALLKTLRDFIAIDQAEAQVITNYRPALPATYPEVPVSGSLNNSPQMNAAYGNFNCDIPATPNTQVGDCVTFRICTKLNGSCAATATKPADEYIYQTLIFNKLPTSQLEN